MWDCIGSLLFLIWMIVFCYLFGYSIRKDQHFSKNIISGYIGYSFILAVGFMIVELFELPWKLALIYFCITLIGIFLYIIYSMEKYHLKLTKNDFKDLIKENYFMFIIIVILMLISFISFSIYWLNNHLDDGYYLSKIVKMPHLDTPYSYNYVVNCKANSSIAYKINTWELEASIYVYLLKINVFTYCRLGLNFFNYLLLCSTVSVFTTKIYEKTQLKQSVLKFIQFVPIVFIFFATNMNTVYDIGFMHLVDHWQFVTAMYLGSSIPRTMGLLWIIMSFIDNEKISINDMIQLFIISVVLMSKSTIALPIIVLTSVVLYFAIYFKRDTKKILLLIPFLLYFVIGYILPDRPDIQSSIRSLFNQNIKTLPFIASSFVFIISFAFRKKIINKINITLILLLALMLIPEVNDVFETFSVFNFVACRMFTTLMYTFYITAFIYVLFALVIYCKKSILKPILLIITCIITGCSVLTYTARNISVKHSFSVIAHNYRMVPNSTLELGRTLDEISKKRGTLYVLTPEFVLVNGLPHPLATIITTVSNNTVSYSAIRRYNVDSDDKIATFKDQYQDVFNQFSNTRTNEDFEKCLTFIEEYGINTFILPGDNTGIDSYGDFKKTNIISDPSAGVMYSIFVKAK